VRSVRVGSFAIGGGRPLAFILGPCVIESPAHALDLAGEIGRIGAACAVPVVFKASYDKANRTSLSSFRGPGLDSGLRTLADIKSRTGLPILTDIHDAAQAAPAAEVADIIQIPAFLSRQTSLLVAAAQTGKVVNVKKGQFLAPDEMQGVVGKLQRAGCERILLTERGVCFGYKQLVADMTALPIMQRYGYPVVFDAGHQVRRSGVPSHDPKGGAPEFIPTLLRASVAAGANGVFLETHPNPPAALCDAASQYPLDAMESLMADVQQLGDLIREQSHA